MSGSRVKVTIFGQTYTINGDASPEYIKNLADYLNAKMEEVSGTIASSNPVQVAILAALNVADEYFQMKNMKSGIDVEVERRAKALISMLDEGLIGDYISRFSAAQVPERGPSPQ